MSKVLSTRLDEDVIAELESATRRLGMTRKRFLEEAIRLRAVARSPEDADEFFRALHAAYGAWKRDETPDETIQSLRQPWEDSYARFADRASPEPSE
jgi:predicted transcriptional regulator